jgi:hypothetical protein
VGTSMRNFETGFRSQDSGFRIQDSGAGSLSATHVPIVLYSNSARK